MKEKLALRGGPKAIPDGAIKPWPPVDEVDRRMVLASLEGGQHTFGPNCRAFQEEFAAWNGNKYAITTNSGTAVLHMCIVACGCGVGDEVIVPAYSWSSSVTCVLHHNAIPVFVDIDFDTMNIGVDRIEAAITPRTKAIVVVHLHGLAVDMERVMAIADNHGLKVIEDACQAHGAKIKGKKVGTWGHCAAFSLNQNKCLCSGEGGMFTTDDEDLLAKAQSLWSFGETRTPLEDRDYHAYALGWMYRNNDLSAIVNFACHPTHSVGGALSAGFPGVLAAHMKAPGCPVTLFLNGASGNLHTSDPSRGGVSKSKEEVGALLAEDVRRIMNGMTFRDQVKLGCASRTIQLPFRTITDAEVQGTVPGAQRFADPAIYDREMPGLLERIRRMETQPAEVQVIFLDEYAVVGIPAEYFIQHALRIKEEACPYHALVVGQANGMVGYVPHKEAFRRGGYETTLYGSSRLAPEAGDLLAEDAIKLIAEAGLIRASPKTL